MVLDEIDDNWNRSRLVREYVDDIDLVTEFRDAGRHNDALGVGPDLHKEFDAVASHDISPSIKVIPWTTFLSIWWVEKDSNLQHLG